MNIARLLSGIIGTKLDSVEPRLVELKVGQVVRGVVLQMLAEQDALVNIAGTPVRAKLEAPLAQGQATLLQVQPESSSGQIVLKPLTASGVPIAESSLTEIANSLGLKDTETGRVIMRALHAAGIPLEAKTARAFQHAAEDQPSAKAPMGEWIEAAVIAFKKGMPLKPEIVGPIHQAVFGKPLGTTLNALQNEIAQYLHNTSTMPTAESEEAPLALTKLQDALMRMSELQARHAHEGQPQTSEAAKPTVSPPLSLSHALQQTASDPLTMRQSGTHVDPSFQDGMMKQEIPVERIPADKTPTERGQSDKPLPEQTRAPQPMVDRSQADQPHQERTPQANQLIESDRMEGAATDRQAAEKQRIETSAKAQAAPSAEADPIPDMQDEVQPDSRGSAAAIQDGRAVEPQKEGQWIKSLFKQLGLDYEHKAFEALNQPSPDSDSFAAAKDTVKGLIMQLQADTSLPPALKESLQQTLQQITGQQLLMTGDKNAPISLITMQIPIQQGSGESGEQATVQIQARRKAGGRFDSENCRLIFDLSMQRLGNTLVDVQVMNRVVSLQVHNDHPLIGGILNASKTEIEAALAGVGYQFISMKHLPYPEFTQRGGDAGVKLPAGASAVAATYGSKPYKGVDLKV